MPVACLLHVPFHSLSFLGAQLEFSSACFVFIKQSHNFTMCMICGVFVCMGVAVCPELW